MSSGFLWNCTHFFNIFLHFTNYFFRELHIDRWLKAGKKNRFVHSFFKKQCFISLICFLNHIICLSLTVWVFLTLSDHHININSFSCSYFHGHCSPDLFIVFDAMNRHQRVPDDEAICPHLLCPGLHPLCPQYFVWVPSSNSQQNHIANTFFCVCFNYWPARFDSQHHGSASTNKLTSGPRIFRFIQTAWSMWSVLDAPMTVSLQCQCL